MPIECRSTDWWFWPVTLLVRSLGNWGLVGEGGVPMRIVKAYAVLPGTSPGGAGRHSWLPGRTRRSGIEQGCYLRGHGYGPWGDFAEELPTGQQRVDDVAPPPCQTHHRSIVFLAFSPFTQVVVP